MSDTTKEKTHAHIVGAESIGNGRVRVTFNTGVVVECPDDGSFWQWTGGMETVQRNEGAR